MNELKEEEVFMCVSVSLRHTGGQCCQRCWGLLGYWSNPLSVVLGHSRVSQAPEESRLSWHLYWELKSVSLPASTSPCHLYPEKTQVKFIYIAQYIYIVQYIWNIVTLYCKHCTMFQIRFIYNVTMFPMLMFQLQCYIF